MSFRFTKYFDVHVKYERPPTGYEGQFESRFKLFPYKDGLTTEEFQVVYFNLKKFYEKDEWFLHESNRVEATILWNERDSEPSNKEARNVLRALWDIIQSFRAKTDGPGIKFEITKFTIGNWDTSVRHMFVDMAEKLWPTNKGMYTRSIVYVPRNHNPDGESTRWTPTEAEIEEWNNLAKRQGKENTPFAFARYYGSSAVSDASCIFL